jgi:phosphoglucosamine mutase
MTAEFALRLASAAARVLAPGTITGKSGARRGRVAIGKDTRVSGYMFESALEAGFVAAGMDVMLLGPLPTPGIAHLTQALGADLGVVISASHNPYEDNGIKFFDRSGAKLSDAIEATIEEHLNEPAITRDSSSLGRAKRIENAGEQYQQFCINTVPESLRLDGLKIVVDCSHGAGYKVAPRAITALGAEIVPIGCSPNGRNINSDCGSTHPELATLTVRGVGADIGIAFDGDGDRVLMIDPAGHLIDGDQLLYVLALARHARGTLRGPVIGTQMTNLGLELALRSRGIDFRRAKVGDRYVLEMLREAGGELGGETSGHILCLDKTTTGDGLVTALQVLCVMKESGKSIAELVSGMPKYPQVLINVRTSARVDLKNDSIQHAVQRAEQHLGRRGRVVLRASGTEPVVRVMVEGEDGPDVQRLAEEIAAEVRQSAAA